MSGEILEARTRPKRALPLLQPLASRARAALLAAFLLATFFLASMPVGDGDYYWHIAHGRAIVERGGLPAADTFNHALERLPSTAETEHQSASMLRRYWLAQIGLYLLHKATGEAGVVALRAAVYTALAAAVYLIVGARANRATGLLSSLLLADLLLEYPSERPTLLSYLWTFAALQLLERYDGVRGRGRAVPAAALAGVMWLWANTHGSFPLGIFFIGAYAAGHVWHALVSSKRRVEAGYLLPLLGAAAASLLNPQGVGSVTYGFWFIGSHDPTLLHEMLPPFLAARDFQEYYPAYWIFLALTVAGLAVNRKRLRAPHLLVLLGLAALSLTGIRYMIYLPLAAPLAAFYPLLRGRWSEVVPLFPLLIAAWFATQDYRLGFSFGTSPLFPVRAAGRLPELAAAGSGELFNYYDWGGYLKWRDPKRRVFIDGSNYHPGVDRAYQSILWNSEMHVMLAKFNVAHVFVPGMSNYSGKVFPLVRALHRSADWRLTYANEEALLFSRSTPPKDPGESLREGAMIRAHLEQRARTIARYFLDSPGVRLTGEIAGSELRGLPREPPAGTTPRELEAHRL